MKVPSMATPQTIRAGTTANWTVTIDDYAASSGWSATYTLRAAGQSDITISTTGNGTTYTVDVAPATTTGYAADTYFYVLTVTDGTDTHEIDTGIIEVLAATQNTSDLLAAKANLATAISNYNSAMSKVAEFGIKDRNQKQRSLEEMRAAISYWQRRVNHLEEADRRRRGFPSKNVSYVRFR